MIKNKISIIIPTLNEAQNIAQLIPFLFENGKNFIHEIIVADADSDDQTVLIAQEKGAKTIVSPCGRAVQMNRAAAIAEADILYFVHADTFPPKHFATSILEALEVGKEAGCFPFVFDSASFLLKINAYFTRFPFLWCRGGDQTLFITKDFFEKLGGFDEKYSIMEEYDFILRAKKYQPFHILKGNVLVSARKYEENGYFRVQIANFLAFNMFRLNFSQTKILNMYKKILNTGRLSWRNVHSAAE
jgi:rSAM/selenodomain-associated transferase 2